MNVKHYRLFYTLSAVIFALTFIAYFYNPLFTPDSWSYFELSKTIDKEFYKINTWRQYQYDNGYGASFPPLWPALIWLFNKIFDTGIYAGYYLNFIILVSTFFSIFKLTSRISSEKLFGFFMFFSLITSSYYIDEIVSARAIPLSVLLTTWIIYFITREQVTKKTSISIAILAGMMVLNRFDFLAPSLLLGFLLLYLSKSKLNLLLYYLFLFLIISPWIIYSLHHFNAFFISDNARTVLSSFYTYVNDYYNFKVPTILDDPLAWLAKSSSNIIMASVGFLKALILLLPFVLLFIFLYWKKQFFFVLRKPKYYSAILGLILTFSVQILSIFFTGYDDSRYYSMFFLTMLFFLLSILVNSTSLSELGQNKIIRISLLLCLLISVIFIIKPVLKMARDYNKHRLSFNYYNLPNEYTNGLKMLILSYESNPKILFLNNFGEINAFRFGALTDLQSFSKPRNLSAENISNFIDHYGINIIVIDETISETAAFPNHQTKVIFSKDGFKILTIQKH